VQLYRGLYASPQHVNKIVQEFQHAGYMTALLTCLSIIAVLVTSMSQHYSSVGQLNEPPHI